MVWNKADDSLGVVVGWCENIYQAKAAQQKELIAVEVATFFQDRVYVQLFSHVELIMYESFSLTFYASAMFSLLVLKLWSDTIESQLNQL